MDKFLNHQITHWDKKSGKSSSFRLIGEEPLSIRVEGNPYSVVMRTPGEEIPHIAGFCLTEGIADNPDDITSIGFCDSTDTNVVTVTIKQSRREKIPKHFERRGFISQTSCGLCGKEIVDELFQILNPITDDTKAEINTVVNCLETLSQYQPLRRETRAAHAAAIYSSDYTLLSVAEDVGRHNALDKAIGKIFLERKLQHAFILVLSSRISYELVQKAARARIPIILAMSRPTSLAVQLASKLNMTLACLARNEGIYIFCGEHRLIS